MSRFGGAYHIPLDVDLGGYLLRRSVRDIRPDALQIMIGSHLPDIWREGMRELSFLHALDPRELGDFLASDGDCSILPGIASPNLKPGRLRSTQLVRLKG